MLRSGLVWSGSAGPHPHARLISLSTAQCTLPACTFPAGLGLSHLVSALFYICQQSVTVMHHQSSIVIVPILAFRLCQPNSASPGPQDRPLDGAICSIPPAFCISQSPLGTLLFTMHPGGCMLLVLLPHCSPPSLQLQLPHGLLDKPTPPPEVIKGYGRATGGGQGFQSGPFPYLGPLPFPPF